MIWAVYKTVFLDTVVIDGQRLVVVFWELGLVWIYAEI